ncbi:uncharacterized protein DUF3159 [Microbacterium sp. SLBN-154]|uniref:DUF3159 domain-containing protein n=1 Tax=Microbacterium sp. SLBN-154 TaxID=2768458 RepID=UPI0011507960|nr:DUF3159 domain-containing protein [Microbacterium sp. SLBN-154]TQK19496.1 uncharacterized protein DUF3159 [Microbacterium sp. SLBN-154]
MNDSPTGVHAPDPEPAPGAGDQRASELLGAALGGAAKRAGLDPTQQGSTGRVVWSAMGGWRGVLESVLPSLTFILTYTLVPGDTQEKLIPALAVSVGIAAVFTIVRLVQKSPPSAAIGGLVAAGVAAGLALITGNPSDNFIPGFITNAVYGSALLVSALVGWPIIGLAVGFLVGEGTRWRMDRRKRRAFFWLTIAWAALFAARLAVQFPIYLTSLDESQRDSAVALLGTLKLVMGIPLFAPLLAVTWLVVRALYPPAPK